jgi:hydrogenase expression/formation protein HypD
MAAWQAQQQGLTNFSLLVSHVLAPPAIRGLLTYPGNRVQGFIAPGHVCTVMGCGEYEDLVNDFDVPIVVGRFEPIDLLQAVQDVKRRRSIVSNAFERVRPGFGFSATRVAAHLARLNVS